MTENIPRNEHRHDDLTRRIQLFWIAIMVAAPLALTGAFYLLFEFSPAAAPADQPPFISSDMIYVGLIGLYGLFLLGMRPLARRLLAPERLSTITLQSPPAHMTTRQEAALRVQTGTMMLLAIIDLPIILALCLSYLDAEIGYALLAVGYGVLSTAMARPDPSTLVQQLEQQLANQRRNTPPS